MKANRGGVWYWNLFRYGSEWSVCSEHRSEKAANAAKRRCEQKGGANHKIARVEFLKEGRVSYVRK